MVGIGPLRLGMLKEELISVMNSNKQSVSSTAHGHLYFLENSIQVEFQPNGEASFIGVAPHAKLSLTFQGVNLFDKHSDEVFALFQKNEGVDIVQQDQHEHIFLKQIVTLWDPDEQYDLNGENQPVWGQIGVGNSDYLEDIKGL